VRGRAAVARRDQIIAELEAELSRCRRTLALYQSAVQEQQRASRVVPLRASAERGVEAANELENERLSQQLAHQARELEALRVGASENQRLRLDAEERALRAAREVEDVKARSRRRRGVDVETQAAFRVLRAERDAALKRALRGGGLVWN
jgi:hypothetical protein